MSARTCGSCSACCSIVPVKEIGVRAFTRCPKVRDVLHAAGPGCSIYADRPHSCRAWSCVWLKAVETLGPEMRPDRSGIVIDEVIDLIRINGQEMPAAQIWVAPGYEDDFKTVEPVQRAISALLDRKLAVLWRLPPGTHAVAIHRVADGRIEYSAPIHVTAEDAPGSLGPDEQRLARAADLFEMVGR